MKRFLLAGGCLWILAITAIQLHRRWSSEAVSHSVTFMVDWSEVRDMASRTGMKDEDLLRKLGQAGANAVLISPETVLDYLHRDFIFPNRASAENIHQQLLNRGVGGVTVRDEGGRYRLVNTLTSWDTLKDLEVGFDSDLLRKVQDAGLRQILRINQDPWLSKEKLWRELQLNTQGLPSIGFLLNTDEAPGSNESLPDWQAFLEGQGYVQLMFEFHPSKSAIKLAFRTPASTFRAHTIPSNELKDLTLEQQKARWSRAARERTCRFLLFHGAPNAALADFLGNLTTVRDDFVKQGWIIAWPQKNTPRPVPSTLTLQACALVAFIIAVMAPIYALRGRLNQIGWRPYAQVAGVCLFGACVMAAVADNPLTRIEVLPFRGVKAAFALAWVGSILSLYRWDEIKKQLYLNVRRVDVLAGLGALAILGYVLVRMGNASAGWKVGWEQGLRDHLEALLVARPRFKEFAIGYPLLFLGFSMKRESRAQPWHDRRFWIALGMLGPISMVNTFCHLHSPLYLAFWRSLNGFVLGSLIGVALVSVKKWLS